MSLSEFHFTNYLTRKYVETIKSQYGFRDAIAIEKFIMDFEILYHILQEMDQCVVKGGMAVPFHIGDKRARRLSEDIDFVTPLEKAVLMSKMEKVAARVKPLATITPCPTLDGPKSIPKISYDVKYNSVFGKEDIVKVDIIHSFNISQIQPLVIPKNSELFAFTTDYDIPVFSKGSLVGDKITTLAFDTIGINPSGIRTTDIAKQIYDLALLIENCDANTIENALSTYGSTCDFQCDIRGKFSSERIADDISKSIKSFLKLDSKGFTLTDVAENRYHNFKNQLLSSDGYSITEHKNDILLLRLFATYLQLYSRQLISLFDLAARFYQNIQQLNKVKATVSGKERDEIRKTIVDSIGLTDHNRRHLHRATPEQALLYQLLSSNLKQMGF